MAELNEKELRARLLKPLEEIQNQVKNNPPVPTQNSGMIRNPENSMTLEKYVSNPTGRGSAYVANRSAIKNGLIMKYIKLLRNFRKAFYAIPYIYKNGDILFYVKVPSQHYDYNKISYDVCFLLKYDKKLKRGNREMQLYCNSPGFIFTYCYVYNQDGLIIDKLKSKLPNQALSQPPTVRNPIQSYGYEAASFIAAYYLITGHCLTDEYINRFGKILTPQMESDIFNKIADPETLISVYQHAEYNHRKNHRKELSANEKAKKDQFNKDYAEQQKKNKPKSNFITHKAPRSKITARKAKKSLMNDNK